MLTSNKALVILGLERSLSQERRIEEARSSFVARDGEPVHPQPIRDILDPLNWTSLRKHSILSIVMWQYFMFTYITTTTVPSFPELQQIYNIDYAQVNWTVAIPSLGLAFGPLIWSSLADIYGRRTIFLVGTSIAFAATIVTAVSRSYAVYMAARFFQGLGASPGGTVGMAVVNDLFFDYERGQKLGYWVLAINTGLLVGPIFGGLIDIAGPFWVDWLTAILFGTLLLMELIFLPETLYPRTYMAQVIRKSRGMGLEEKFDLKRTTSLPFLNLKPVPGIRHPKPWDSLVRFGLTFKYPVVVLTVSAYCFAWYWWILSIITFIPAAYVQYSASTQGLFFTGLLLGSWFAEIFCSGRLSDWLVDRLKDGNGGVQVAEMRLWLAYPAALLSAAGLILWGISIDQCWHWITGQAAFFISPVAMGLQMGNTVVPSYVIDCYPLQSMSVITFYSILLDISALINPFFIATWVEAAGYTDTFTVQGIITCLVCIPVIALVHHFGARIREESGQPNWVNPEFDVL